MQLYPAALLITSLKILNEEKVLLFSVLLKSENHPNNLNAPLFFKLVAERGGMDEGKHEGEREGKSNKSLRRTKNSKEAKLKRR